MYELLKREAVSVSGDYYNFMVSLIVLKGPMKLKVHFPSVSPVLVVQLSLVACQICQKMISEYFYIKIPVFSISVKWF